MKHRGGRSAALLTVAALIAAACSAWLVFDYTGSAQRRGGAPTTVLVAAAPIRRGQLLAADDLDALAVGRTVPSSYAPLDRIASLEALAGSRAAADIPQGAYLTNSMLVPRSRGAGYRLRASERAVTVDARVAPDDAELLAGSRVDLLSSGVGGANQTSLLLSGAEVLAIDAAARGDQARITLRTTAEQAIALIRADVFARELRAVMWP